MGSKKDTPELVSNKLSKPVSNSSVWFPLVFFGVASSQAFGATGRPLHPYSKAIGC